MKGHDRGNAGKYTKGHAQCQFVGITPEPDKPEINISKPSIKGILSHSLFSSLLFVAFKENKTVSSFGSKRSPFPRGLDCKGLCTPKDTVCEVQCALCGLLFYTEKKKSARYRQKRRENQGDFRQFDYCFSSVTTAVQGVWMSFLDTEEAHAVMLAHPTWRAKGKSGLKAPAEPALLNRSLV